MLNPLTNGAPIPLGPYPHSLRKPFSFLQHDLPAWQGSDELPALWNKVFCFFACGYALLADIADAQRPEHLLHLAKLFGRGLQDCLLNLLLLLDYRVHAVAFQVEELLAPLERLPHLLYQRFG